jgi:hypothetical protein
MLRTRDNGVAAVQAESDLPIPAFSFGVHPNCPEGRGFDIDFQLLDRGHQHMAAVRLAPENRREQPDHRRAADRRALVIPGAVARDAHVAMAAAVRIPLLDRR